MPRLAEIDRWDRASLKEAEYSRGQAMAYGSRYHSAALSYFLCAGLSFLILLAGGDMLVYEHIPSLPAQAREDLSQIEAGFLTQAEVWISPKTRPARLPGPYGEGQPALTTRCGITGEDTGHAWVSVYIPDVAGFSLDRDRLFDENQTLEWNWEHARRYQVSYTSNFHLVVDITPIED